MSKVNLFTLYLLVYSAQLYSQNVKNIDLTSKKDDSKYFVVICGRNNTITGHAFIVWGREDAILQQSVLDGAFGLYAKETGSTTADGIRIFKAFFSKVPGEIADEFYKGSLTQELIRFIIQVDKSDYDKTLAIKNTWEGRNDYHIFENDCITFVTEIAENLKLTLPKRIMTDRPWNYIEKILTLNNQSNYLSGIWEVSDQSKRFRLEIKDNNCVWTERSVTGQTLTRSVEIIKENNTFKIYRPNDDSVLTFLGFQPNIRTQVLSRGANPSFIEIKRIDNLNIQGLWNGIMIIKDSNANLVEIKQPGTFPSKQFDFKREY